LVGREKIFEKFDNSIVEENSDDWVEIGVD
jgi:hypothetical protein